MLKLFQPLMQATTATISFSLSKNTDGLVSLTVMPICAKLDHDDEELKVLKAALSIPLKIVGNDFTEIEVALGERIQQEMPKRNEWAERCQQVESLLAQAKEKKESTKETGKKAVTPSLPVKSALAKAVDADPKPTASIVEDDVFEL